MRSPHELIAQWNQAIAWNSLLFFVSQFSKTLVTAQLFCLVSTDYFMIWANTQSIVFIAIYWLDCGFTRSVPQYITLFNATRERQQQFFYTVVVTKLALATAALTVLSILMQTTTLLTNYTTFVLIGMVLFVVETVRSVLRMWYHAHFQQKYFNSLEGLVSLMRVAIVVTLPLLCDTRVLVISLLWYEIVTGLIIVVLASRRLFMENNWQREHDISHAHVPPASIKDFAKHSLMMWSMTVLASLSDRNVLVPCIAYFGGGAMASIFKVANDSALLLHRFIAKTIGTTDTALLSRTRDFSKTVWDHINRRLVLLTVPLLGLAPLALLYPAYHNSTELVTVFLVLTACYLGQQLCAGYSRIAEVAHDYYTLLVSEVPYLILVVGVFMMWILGLRWQLELLPIIFVIHGVRFLSLGIRIVLVRRNYDAQFPVWLALRVLGMTLLLSGIINLLMVF